MSVLLFVLIPLLAVTAYAVVSWLRNRQPTSVESGIDAFRREMSALSPEAAPIHRRVDPRAVDDVASVRVEGPEGPEVRRPTEAPEGREAPRRPGAGPDRRGGAR